LQSSEQSANRIRSNGSGLIASRLVTAQDDSAMPLALRHSAIADGRRHIALLRKERNGNSEGCDRLAGNARRAHPPFLPDRIRGATIESMRPLHRPFPAGAFPGHRRQVPAV
jgi:hypothetical protein